MNLLFVIKTLSPQGGSGGAERVLTNIVSALHSRGHDVTVLSFDPPGEPEFYQLDKNIPRLKIGLGKCSHRTTPLEMAARATRLRREIRRLRPDAVTGFMHSAYVPLVPALAGTGIPLVASDHIVFDHYESRPIQRSLVLLAGRAAAAMTTISEAVRMSFPPSLRERMTVLPNPVLAGPEVGADPAGASAPGKTLLCVGRLEPQKDHLTLVRAFGLIAHELPEWNLRIIGEGAERPRLEAAIAALGLGSRIQLPGRTQAIEREYRAAQLFVMPSLYESFGLATAEAFTYGLPAVGFADCPGTNELIVDGVNGVLVTPGEDRAEALAEALRRLLALPELRIRLGAAAPATVERFSLEKVADRWEELLRAVAFAVDVRVRKGTGQ